MVEVVIEVVEMCVYVCVVSKSYELTKVSEGFRSLFITWDRHSATYKAS